MGLWWPRPKVHLKCEKLEIGLLRVSIQPFVDYLFKVYGAPDPMLKEEQ